MHGELMKKHNELVSRGDIPGSDHLIKRGSSSSSLDSGILYSNTPTISPAVALDEDGDDISTLPFPPFKPFFDQRSNQ